MKHVNYVRYNTNCRLTGLSSLHLTTLTITNSVESVGGALRDVGAYFSRAHHVTTAICLYMNIYYSYTLTNGRPCTLHVPTTTRPAASSLAPVWINVFKNNETYMIV